MTAAGGDGEDSIYADPGDDAYDNVREASAPPPPACSDTDGGAEDEDGYSCSDYTWSYCGGDYDDSDFSSDDMCCVCGGGGYD